MVKKSGEFVFVKGTQKHANEFKIKGVPSVFFSDGDADEIHRARFADERTLTDAMATALKKYTEVPISWGAEIKPAAGKKLLVVGFDDEEGRGLRVLEDRRLVKYHALCEFVKLAAGADTLRAWNVSQTPAVFLCDPVKPNPQKSCLEKLTGKKTPAQVKAALVKALRKLEQK